MKNKPTATTAVSAENKLEKLFGNSASRLYPAGEVIVCAGREPEGVMLVDSGIVEQYDIAPTGSKLVVNRFKPKAFFPMAWAINRLPNDYFYSAATGVSLRCLPADTVLSFVEQNPDVALDLLSRVYSGTDRILRRLVLASCGGAASRVIYELLNEAYRFGQAHEDAAWRVISIKQQNVADRSGLARETVSRELNKLEKAGLIIHSRQGLAVFVDRLEASLV